MNQIKPILAEMGLEYKKNKLKKIWLNLPENEKSRITAGDLSGAKNALCMQIMGEKWDESDEFQKRWREFTNQTKKEFEDLCAELEALI